MADLWDTAIASIGDDFERWTVGLIPVTVNQIEPDSGAVMTSVSNVPAQTTIRRLRGGDLVPDQTAPFIFRADRLSWLPKHRDQVVTQDGTVWEIQPEGVTLIAAGQLARAQTIIKRS